MDQKTYAIFLSCGTPDTVAQEEFIAAVEACLKSHGCEPQTVGRSKFSSRQPVQASRDLIGSCDGAVVIAFERTRILEGVERPGSKTPKPIRDEAHPTIWNQMEASMAYAQRVPILTLVESGLKRQGMLSDRLEWSAIEDRLAPTLLSTEKFRQIFAEWLMYVQNGKQEAKRINLDLPNMKIADIAGQLTTSQFLALGASVLGSLGAVAGFCFWFGTWWQSHYG
jgi:hypothetical protein